MTAGTPARRWSSVRLRLAFADAWRAEVDERRLFLWLPVAAGTGVILYLKVDTEPSLPIAAAFFVAAAVIAFVVRSRPMPFRCAVIAAAIFAGFVCGGLRTARVAAPVLDRIRILKLGGFVEELDLRREGARFVLRVVAAEGLSKSETPYRVRLTTRRTPDFAAGAYVTLQARLLPPARAALPGGYDFARDAFFARLGAVGSVLGRIEPASAPVAADFGLRFFAAVDRARNALAQRVERVIGGPAGAVGAAMVTGKRDFLDDPTRELIRAAGIFHIITIAGVQMTLVAGIFFWGFRRLLALSPMLALHYPIKKWAAGLAILGALAYDVATGSRVGTERALVMTIVMLGAVICDRQAFSMRNLALAVLVIIAIEPEALLGASFQLSFAAVAALVAAWEARRRHRRPGLGEEEFPLRPAQVDRQDRLLRWLDALRRGPGGTLFATLCATSATASFMAYNFHELSPYVLVGNPLTLAIIELFAVPGALLGAVLAPLGLDGLVWSWLGLGINFVLWAAGWIAALPGATLHLHRFAPWAIVFLTLAVLSAVLWRSPLMRLTAAPLAAIGLVGTMCGETFDLVVPPSGDVVAARLDDGDLAVFGRRPSAFIVEQWLRADADGRAPPDAVAALAGSARAIGSARFRPPDGDLSRPRCDALGCTAMLDDGRVLALVLDAAAFAEDCGRADIVVAPLFAPAGCAADIVIDRRRLETTGAQMLRLGDDSIRVTTARAVGEDRPWSPAPRRLPARAPPSHGPNDSSLATDDAEVAPFR